MLQTFQLKQYGCICRQCHGSQATLLLQIIEQSRKEEGPEAFLTRCKLVDQVSRLNDSKRRNLETRLKRAANMAADIARPNARGSPGLGRSNALRHSP